MSQVGFMNIYTSAPTLHWLSHQRSVQQGRLGTMLRFGKQLLLH